MSELAANKGPWTHRFLIHLFTVVLTVLVYWLIGFVIDDIGSWPGPIYDDVEKRLLDPDLLKKSTALGQQSAETERTIARQKERQRILRDSTQNSQATMNQLLEFQKLNLQKSVTPTADEQSALAESEKLFLANQKEYQLLNEKIAELNDELANVQQQQRELDKTLEERRVPIRAEFESLYERHNLFMAGLKLAALMPLLVVAVVLFLKKRSSLYAPLIYACGIALLLKVALVMHEYFPSRYFKYVLILTCLVVVVRVLTYLLRMVAFPKRDWLLKQYREAYEAFFCPVCEYPIRRGPLKYVFWSRRSVKKLQFPPAISTEPEQPYTCPMCSTRLFEECTNCHGIRHSLLPACEKCGAETTVNLDQQSDQAHKAAR